MAIPKIAHIVINMIRFFTKNDNTTARAIMAMDNIVFSIILKPPESVHLKDFYRLFCLQINKNNPNQQIKHKS